MTVKARRQGKKSLREGSRAEKRERIDTTMRTREEAIRFCKSFPGVFEDYSFHDQNWTCMRIVENKKIFAWIYQRNGAVWINVKCDVQWRDFWRNAYASVVPAYHMNKEHWNSIILDGTVPEKDVRRMIGESFELCGGQVKKTKEEGEEKAHSR